MDPTHQLGKVRVGGANPTLPGLGEEGKETPTPDGSCILQVWQHTGYGATKAIKGAVCSAHGRCIAGKKKEDGAWTRWRGAQTAHGSPGVHSLAAGQETVHGSVHGAQILGAIRGGSGL